MSLLIFAYRKQDILRRRSDINYKLMQLHQKLMDLQSYATSVSDGSVSISDLMNCPTSLFGRMTAYMFTSDQSARAYANQQLPMMMMTPGAIPQNMNPQMAGYYQQMVFQNLYKQQQEQFKKHEESVLNEQNKKVDSEIARLEGQLKMLDAEFESVKSAEDKAAQSSAPKYA